MNYYTITGIPTNDILSNLPVELTTIIITNYSGHFRVDKKDNKRRLIQQIDPIRKENFEKIYKRIQPIVNIQGIFSTNPLITHKLYILIKDLDGSVVIANNMFDNEKITGSLNKYQIIIKYFYLNDNTFNPYRQPMYDYECYSGPYVTTKYGHHMYDLKHKKIISETFDSIGSLFPF